MGFSLMVAVPVGATSVHKEDHKVWVCKYVGTPHEDERLKDGKNPIYVDDSSIKGPGVHDPVRVGDTFADAHDHSIVVQIGGSDPGIESCPGHVPPTTTTVPVTTTTVVDETTTTTVVDEPTTTVVDETTTTVADEVTTTTVPEVTTTEPPTTTVPEVTTTVPEVTTTEPPTTTVPEVTTTVPEVTTTTTVAQVHPPTTTLPPTTTVINKPTPAPLPATGSNTAPIMALASIVLLLGGVLVLVRRITI
jgi:LPXTG-motif cell wall-anchored protein